MSNSSVESAKPKKGRRWLKVLASAVLAIFLLAVVAYFVLTSSAFFKGSILPRVSAALNASVTVSDAAIHPFSAITLRDLRVQPAGKEPLVTAPEVRVRYHLWDILGGNIHVDEIALVSPTIEVVENPDGSRNVDPILKALQAKPGAEKQSATAKSSKPLQVALGKLTLNNATVRQTKIYDTTHRDVVDLANLNVTLANLQNGQTAKLELASDIRVDKNPPSGTNSALAASLKGSFDLSLSPELKPGSATGSATFSVTQAGGALGDFNTFGVNLNCEVTPAEIKQLALRFQKAGAPLGEVAVAGPFDAQKTEGKLNVNLRGIDHRLLDLAGAKNGIAFGTTTIDAATTVELAKAGAAINATGKFTAGKVQVTQAGQTTPTLDLSADYDVALDRTAQTATLRNLNLTGTQNNIPLLNAQLSSPMNLAWGNSAGNVGDAAFNLTITNLNLTDWKPFLGNNAPAGKIGVKLQVSSREAGKDIAFDLKSDVSNLAVQIGSNHISQAAVSLSAQGQAAQFKRITLSSYAFEVALQNQTALTSSGSGSYDLSTGDADLQVKLQAALARLLQALPQPGLSVASGDVELDARVAQKQKMQTVAGKLTLSKFDGQSGKNEFHDFSGKFDLDVANSPQQIQINKFAGNFSQGGNAGGDFELSGKYDLAQKSAEADVKISSLNENALRPFLQPLLAGKTLATVAVSGTVSGQYQPAGSSSVKANVQVSNLVVNDPQKQIPATPLAAGVQVDASLDKQTADVRQLQLTLTPTSRASNQLQFSGHVDFSNTNAIQGNLKLASEALDLTSYYDLFAGGTNATAKAATAAAPAPSAASAEPAAVKLPLQNFTLAANIAKLYLHEVAITNFQTTVKIDGGHVVTKPFQLTLNGAPVSASADLDLGVPGYKYNVGFDAKAVPLAPLVNTFQPARAGQMGGTATTTAQISGAGISGASLQKNLAGQFALDLTNLNLSVVNIHSRLLKTVVNVVATIPEILSRPENAIASLLGGITGQGGLVKDLEQSPLQFISVQATAGDGKINLQQSTVRSSTFEANATGGIALNAVLTNSVINIPVAISLGQPVAKRLNLAGASTNAAYVPLPQFLTMTGTLGTPKANINKLALAGATVRALGEQLLNPTGTNASPVGELLNQFLKPRK